MATKIELLQEAHKRGILPQNKIPLYQEAVKRGLINSNSVIKSPDVPDMPTMIDEFGLQQDPSIGGTEQRQKPSLMPTTPTPQWGIDNPNLYGLYGAGQALMDTAIRPTVEGAAMAAGSLLSPVAGTSLAYGIANKGMDVVQDYYNKLGNEPVKQRTIPGEMIDSAVTVGSMITVGKAFEAAAPVLDMAGKYLFDKLPKELYGSAIKFPLSKKWVQTLPGREISKRTAVVEEGIASKVPPSEFGVNKAKFLEKEVRKHIDEVTQLLSENPKLHIKVSDVLKNGLKKAYKDARKSGDPVGNQAAIDKISSQFSAHGEFLTPQNANAIKRSLYKEVNWGDAADPITATAKKGIARNIMKQLEGLYPELKGLNQKDMARIGLIEGIERAVGRNANKDMVGLGTKVLLTHPSTWPLALWEATMGHPQIKARLAFALAKRNPKKYSQFIYPDKPPGYTPPDEIVEKMIFKYKKGKGGSPTVTKESSKELRRQAEQARVKLLENTFKYSGARPTQPINQRVVRPPQINTLRGLMGYDKGVK